MINATQIENVLPHYWSVHPTTFNRFLVTECDEPTFYVDRKTGVITNALDLFELAQRLTSEGQTWLNEKLRVRARLENLTK